MAGEPTATEAGPCERHAKATTPPDPMTTPPKKSYFGGAASPSALGN